ncbi:MAG: VOC family protein [Gammaproteobacteria bacterium]|nr:VOC family protein [Gammaproteobacteria bacterium]
MVQDLKIDYLEIPGSNFDALESFYSSVFDWRFTDYGPEYRSFTDGKLDGGFYASQLQSRVENGAALIVFYASDLEETFEKVKKAGGKITRDVFSFPGGRRFHFNDPHGNELAIWSE